MKVPFVSRLFGSGSAIEDSSAGPEAATAVKVASVIQPVAEAAIEAWNSHDASESPSHAESLLTTVGWISAGLGTLVVGLVLGRELRRRYKFNRRTPYDFYAHAGDERDLEFGVGI